MKKIILTIVCILAFVLFVSLTINYLICNYNVMFGDNGISETLGLSFWETILLIIATNVICVIVYSLFKK